jgi:hypothetical protein
MSITKPNLKRQKTLKVPLNDVEETALKKFCTGIGRKQVAPWVRDLVSAHIRQETNRTVEKRPGERPRHGHQHGHAVRFPGRAVAAGNCGRLRL